MSRIRLVLSLLFWPPLVSLVCGLFSEGGGFLGYIVGALIGVVAGLGFGGVFREDGVFANILGGARPAARGGERTWEDYWGLKGGHPWK